jgi:uncharacterized protein YdeI (YjbR/CyaY-like superfamily)
MNRTNPKVDWYFKKSPWRAELEKLREIILECPLTEELKWGKPAYTYDEGNVVILQGFKANCALLFPRGALLKDPKGLLEKPGENTQAARRIPFTNVQEIGKLAPVIKAYLKEAVAIHAAGLEVEYKREPEPIPEELQKALDADATFEAAFHALTPGRQRGYILFFTGARQSKTREARVEKCRPKILNGEGLNDR